MNSKFNLILVFAAMALMQATAAFAESTTESTGSCGDITDDVNRHKIVRQPVRETAAKYTLEYKRDRNAVTPAGASHSHCAAPCSAREKSREPERSRARCDPQHDRC